MNRSYKKKGFTLLELMIVVVIVGILASLAMPKFIKSQLTARSAEALTLLGMLRSSEWRYYLVNDSFTATIDNLDIDNPNGITGVKFTYTVPTATYPNLSVKAEYKVDTTKYITMNQDGVIAKTGF